MPLKAGKKNIGANIRELSHSQTKAGKKRSSNPSSHKMNVAIAMKKAYGK
jgi:hypothetical protein